MALSALRICVAGTYICQILSTACILMTIRISCVPISLMCAGVKQPQKGGCFVSVSVDYFTQRMVQTLYSGR